MFKIVITDLQKKEIANYQCLNENETITLGSAKNNTIVIKSSTVSGEHCAIDVEGIKSSIRNLKGRTGIIINGEKLKKVSSIIKENDSIQIGDFYINLENSNKTTSNNKNNKKKKRSIFTFIFFLLIMPLIIFIIKPEKLKQIEIGEVSSIRKNIKTINKQHKQATTIQSMLSEAKDQYFNDNILIAAKLFKDILNKDKNNFEAATYLEQINKELIPKLETQIDNYIEDRNIVNCVKIVKNLKILDPENKNITKALSFIEGHQKFKAIIDLFNNHRFKKAKKQIQDVVIVDDETLNQWKSKIAKECNITTHFKKIYNYYITGKLKKALTSFKDLLQFDTIQDPLKKIAKEKITLINNFKQFEKLARKDVLIQTAYGVSLFNKLTMNEDSYLFDQVKIKLEKLKQTCGPGTDMFILTQDETSSQIEQARSYKEINEIEFSLSNYKKAVNGLRIISYFTSKKEDKKLAKEVYGEMQNYFNLLKIKSKKMKDLNDFENSDKIIKLLKKYYIAPITYKSKRDFKNKGDDIKLLIKLFTK